MIDYTENKYSARIRLTSEDLDWIKKNKGKLSAAAYLEEVIKEFRKPNLFKKRK